MNPPSPPSAVGPLLRTLLALDRTLPPSDRKLLEALLLHAGPLSARELSRVTGTNLQALYGALDRLEQRGFVARERAGSSTVFRCGHPSVILNSLVEPGKRAAAMAGELEGPLRQLYERSEATPSAPSDESATTTASPTAASSWLVKLIGASVGEIWFLGNESPWFGTAPTLEGEIGKRRQAPGAPRIRMLVPPPERDDPRRPHHARLQRAGVDVRYTGRFGAPTVIIDRRWLLVRSSASGGAQKGAPVYLRVDSPELCKDLVTTGEDVWARSGPAPTEALSEAVSPPPGKERARIPIGRSGGLSADPPSVRASVPRRPSTP
jgi:DNA-binding transcriptional ArsR family regulator